MKKYTATRSEDKKGKEEKGLLDSIISWGKEKTKSKNNKNNWCDLDQRWTPYLYLLLFHSLISIIHPKKYLSIRKITLQTHPYTASDLFRQNISRQCYQHVS